MDGIVTAVSVGDVILGIAGIAAVIATVLVARMGARKLLGMIK